MRARRNSGFTLLEVLVALAVVALGLMAVFGQVSQSATAANRLRDKTLAHWVAQDELTRLRLMGEFPAEGKRSDEVELARITWRYTVVVAKTPVENLRRVDVSVAFADNPDRVVTSLTGFLGRPQAIDLKAAPAADWIPLGEEEDSGP